MIDLNNNIKICDFGIGRILKNETQILYNLKFLDLYYKHRIPFIIMRPRLDLIKRKREKKQKEILARQKFIEEYKNNESHPQKNNIDNMNIKSTDNLYMLIFQNDFEKMLLI